MASAYDPFWMFRLPLGGDVNQRITTPWFSPTVNVNYAGDPAIEHRVVTEVASYGKQIGWLTEVALALAQKRRIPAATLRKLEKAAEAIEAIKKDSQRNAFDAANEALDRLRRENPESFKRLMRQYKS